MAACATCVAQDQEVKTNTERILAHRRTILELLFSERNHVCSVCVANGKCELQQLAQRCGVDHIRMQYRYPELPLDLSNDLFRLDPNRCILCTRCVRVCDEIEGAHTWDVMGRGIECQVITDLKSPWGESDSCTSCGKCVHVCPTGALSQRGTAIAEVHRHRDFPGNAVSDRTHLRDMPGESPYRLKQGLRRSDGCANSPCGDAAAALD